MISSAWKRLVSVMAVLMLLFSEAISMSDIYTANAVKAVPGGESTYIDGTELSLLAFIDFCGIISVSPWRLSPCLMCAAASFYD